MKHTIFSVTFFLAILQGIFAQEQSIIWQSNAGGSSYDIPWGLAIDSQGNFILAGSTLSSDNDVSNIHSTYYEDMFVVKFDPSGNLLWANCFGGTSQDIAYSVLAIDTSIIVSGSTWSDDGDFSRHIGANDWGVLVLAADGKMTHNFAFGGTLSDQNFCAAFSENIFLGGTTVSSDTDFIGNSPVGYDAAIISCKTTGDFNWAKTYGGASTEHFHALLPFDSYILAVGVTESPDAGFAPTNGSADMLISLIDRQSGNALWHKAYGGSNYDVANSVCPLTDTSFVIAGYAASSNLYLHGNKGSYDAWLLAINGSGDTIWSKNYGGSSEDVFNKVIKTKDGNILAVGYTASEDGDVHGHHPGNKDMWMVKLNIQGDTLWTKCIGSIVEDAARDVVETSPNHFVVAGYTQSASGDVTLNYGLSDFWLAEVGEQTSSVAKHPIWLKHARIFPNPANQILNFETDFEQAFGWEILNTQNQVLKKGTSLQNTGKVNISDLPSGSYWLRFSNGRYSVTKKFIVN